MVVCTADGSLAADWRLGVAACGVYEASSAVVGCRRVLWCNGNICIVRLFGGIPTPCLDKGAGVLFARLTSTNGALRLA